MGFYEVKSKTTKDGVGIRVAKSKVARNVPVAYAVKNGITRLVWEADIDAGDIVAAAPLYLTTGRHGASTGNIGDYLLIGGGKRFSSNLLSVETFDKSRTKGVAEDFDVDKHTTGFSVNTSNHVIFLGGSNTDYGDVYDDALTKTNLGYSFSMMTYGEGGSLNGKAFVFDGYAKTLTIIDDALTRTAGGTTSVQQDAVAVSMEKHIVIAGGQYGAILKNVYAVDSAGTERSLADLDNTKIFFSGVYTGSHAIFGGGATYNLEYFKDVAAYDETLTKIPLSPLTNPKQSLGGTRLGKRAIFAGGFSYGNNVVTTYSDADAYDSALTKGAVANLQAGVEYLTAGTIGKWAMFIGGQTASDKNGVTTISVYTLQ